MSTREKLGAELTRRLAELSDWVCRQHKMDAGSTYISNGRMERVHGLAREMESELSELKTLGKKYVELAPEMRAQLQDDINGVGEAIRAFRRIVEGVYHSNLHQTSIRHESVPTYREVTRRHYVRGVSFVGQSVSREYAGQQVVPVLYSYNEQGRVVGRRRIK